MFRYVMVCFVFCLLVYVTCDECLKLDDSDILFLFDYSGSTGNVWPSLMSFTRSILEHFEGSKQMRYSFVHYRGNDGEPACRTTYTRHIGSTIHSCLHIDFKDSERMSTEQIIERLKDGELHTNRTPNTPTADAFMAAEILLNLRSEQDRRSVLIFVGDGGMNSRNQHRINETVNRIKSTNTIVFTARCSSISPHDYEVEEANLRNWASSQNETFNCDEIAKNSPNDTFKYQRLGELVADGISTNICEPPKPDPVAVKEKLLLAGIVSGVLATLFLLLIAIFWSRRRKVKLAKNEQVQVEPKGGDLSQGLGVSMSIEEEVFLPRVTPVKNDRKMIMKMTKVKKKTA